MTQEFGRTAGLALNAGKSVRFAPRRGSPRSGRSPDRPSRRCFWTWAWPSAPARRATLRAMRTRASLRRPKACGGCPSSHCRGLRGSVRLRRQGPRPCCRALAWRATGAAPLRAARRAAVHVALQARLRAAPEALACLLDLPWRADSAAVVAIASWEALWRLHRARVAPGTASLTRSQGRTALRGWWRRPRGPSAMPGSPSTATTSAPTTWARSTRSRRRWPSYDASSSLPYSAAGGASCARRRDFSTARGGRLRRSAHLGQG